MLINKQDYHLKFDWFKHPYSPLKMESEMGIRWYFCCFEGLTYTVRKFQKLISSFLLGIYSSLKVLLQYLYPFMRQPIPPGATTIYIKKSIPHYQINIPSILKIDSTAIILHLKNKQL